MFLNLPELRLRQFCRFSQNTVVNADLADIMEQRGQLDFFLRLRIKAQFIGNGQAVLRHTFRMPPGIGVPFINGRRQGGNRTHEKLPHVLIVEIELAHHEIEGLRQLTDLVVGTDFDLFLKIPLGDPQGTPGEIHDRHTDPAGKK